MLAFLQYYFASRSLVDALRPLVRTEQQERLDRGRLLMVDRAGLTPIGIVNAALLLGNDATPLVGFAGLISSPPAGRRPLPDPRGVRRAWIQDHPPLAPAGGVQPVSPARRPPAQRGPTADGSTRDDACAQPPGIAPLFGSVRNLYLRPPVGPPPPTARPNRHHPGSPTRPNYPRRNRTVFRFHRLHRLRGRTELLLRPLHHRRRPLPLRRPPNALDPGPHLVHYSGSRPIDSCPTPGVRRASAVTGPGTAANLVGSGCPHVGRHLERDNRYAPVSLPRPRGVGWRGGSSTRWSARRSPRLVAPLVAAPRAGTVVVARAQSQGRGRLERSWDSPDGGLYLSVLVDLPTSTPGTVPLAVGAEVRAAIHPGRLELRPEVAERPRRPRPSSVPQKLVGILVDQIMAPDLPARVVVGVGMNVSLVRSALPQELRSRAAILSELTDLRSVSDVERWVVAALRAAGLRLETPEGASGVVAECRRHLYGVGQPVHVDGLAAGSSAPRRRRRDDRRPGRGSRSFHAGDLTVAEAA